MVCFQPGDSVPDCLQTAPSPIASLLYDDISNVFIHLIIPDLDIHMNRVYSLDSIHRLLGVLTDHSPHSSFQNEHISNPYCIKIDGVLEAYYQTLDRVRLSGPTLFAPCIIEAAR